MNIFIFILVGIVGVVLGTWLGRSSKRKAVSRARSMKRQEGERRILEFLAANGQITNNDVEKLLGVADATATRYLAELESDGKITQNKETGRGVFYTLK